MQYQLNNQSCIFLLQLVLSFVLSFSLSVDDIANKDINNKVVAKGTLIINSFVVLLIILKMLGYDLLKQYLNIYYIGLFIILGMSLFLSIYDCSDEDRDDKAFPIIVLIVNIIIVLMMLLNYKR
jgi:cell division protein FtsW (lipid II flippase)